jgi:hypothetical protein
MHSRVRPAPVDRCDECGALLIPRTLEQNDKYHAICSDISKQRDWPKGSGQYLPVECWKQLISYAFERVQGRGASMYPALDGHGLDVVYWHSSRRGKKAMSELIEYATAWAVTEGVTLHDGQA